MGSRKSKSSSINKSLSGLAKRLRKALLEGDAASNEQELTLKNYAKEFPWANQLIFNCQFAPGKPIERTKLTLIK